MPSPDPSPSRHCQPLRGSEHRLDETAVARSLQALPEWKLADAGQAITRSFSFGDYYKTMAFVNALAYIAHREDHHPDLGVHYNRVDVRYSTHDVGGLSENDFICAEQAEQLFASE